MKGLMVTMKRLMVTMKRLMVNMKAQNQKIACHCRISN